MTSTLDGLPSPRVVYCQAYFVTIATILGTGILGLPVTLARSGMYPFLISFLLNAVMQSVLVHFFVDLLQRACAIQLYRQRALEESRFLLSPRSSKTDTDDSDACNVNLVLDQVKIHGRTTPSPNLHLLSSLFLECGLRQMFDILIIFQFISLLVCYALAGSEAYAQVFGIDHYYVIPVFVWVLTLAIIFSMHLIQPVISVLTVLKGSVLLATICVTFYVGVTQGRSSENDYSYMSAPFLMGTVALGGTINTMPFTFEKINFVKEEVENYRLAVQLGLWTCVVLNILWCWSVLDIVPQTVVQACEAISVQIQSLLVQHNSSVPDPGGLCYGELSLESAKMNGEISTIPMTKILVLDYPYFAWVAVLVNVFIMVSITVSYLTIGGALHHSLNGVVHAAMLTEESDLVQKNGSHSCSRQRVVSILMSLLAYLLVFAVAMCDPTGFVDILEKFASLTMNSQAGIFVFLMLLASHKTCSEDIPAPLPLWVQRLVWIIPIFFNAAVIMDLVDTISDVITPRQLLPVVLNDSAGAGAGHVVHLRSASQRS